MWSHPDYVFNADAMLTQLNQVKEVSAAAMQANMDAYVCLFNKATLNGTSGTRFGAYSVIATPIRPHLQYTSERRHKALVILHP